MKRTNTIIAFTLAALCVLNASGKEIDPLLGTASSYASLTLLIEEG